MFIIWPGLWDYQLIHMYMQTYVRAIKKGYAPETIWLLEHTPVYTYGPRTDPNEINALKQRLAGKCTQDLSGKFFETSLQKNTIIPPPLQPILANHLVRPPDNAQTFQSSENNITQSDAQNSFSPCEEKIFHHNVPSNDLTPLVIAANRGGKMTFHGPGQRIIYPLLNLYRRQWSLEHYINLCAQWLIHTLTSFSIPAFYLHQGIWTEKGKIASIGIQVQSGITLHGMALNVSCDLLPFQNISPCGLKNTSMTSIHALDRNVSVSEIDTQLMIQFKKN
jgi:lipoyl(octanoyl) transferase